MEITLEKIELVKDRTGVSYKEAKEALEFAGGNVVRVYDLVDWVSRDSEIAGRSAAAYAIQYGR